MKTNNFSGRLEENLDGVARVCPPPAGGALLNIPEDKDKTGLTETYLGSA